MISVSSLMEKERLYEMLTIMAGVYRFCSSIVRLSDEYKGAMMDYSMDGVPLAIPHPNPIVKVIRC